MTDINVEILVIDDEDIVNISVSKILSREGYQVDTALRADQALLKMEQKNYDLVITDLMMPEMNGIELMHAIRKRGLDAPFLMITGYPTIRTAMQALRLGAIDYIPKPFTRSELLGPVNRALRRRGINKIDENGEQKAPAQSALPGDHFVLPEHSWATYNQDGTMAIGIEESFLSSAGEIEKIEAPSQNEMIEQGYPIIKIITKDGGEHSVFAPFSGRIIALNEKAIEPSTLSSDLWIISIIPSALQAETTMLSKKR